MADKESRDVEASKPQQIGYFKMVFDQKVVTDDIVNHAYEGSGTHDDPYVVNWLDRDPRNPQNFPEWKKWWLTGLVAIATLAVAFVSSAYTGGVEQIIRQFGTSDEVVTLGVSLFVLGFAVGPLMWAPMSGTSDNLRRHHHDEFADGITCRAFRKTKTIHRDICHAYLLQRWGRRIAEHLDSPHPQVLRRRIWLFSLD